MRKKLILGLSIMTIGAVSLATGLSFYFINKNHQHEKKIEFNDYKNNNNFLDFNKFYEEQGVHKSNLEEKVSTASKEFGQKFYKSWFDNLSFQEFKEKNGAIFHDDNSYKLFCDSERQALQLYTKAGGHYWNEFLHNQLEIPEFKDYPTEVFKYLSPVLDKQTYPFSTIRGNDSEYLKSAISKGTSPINMVVYHGVEFMEREFPQQLSEFIHSDSIGGVNFQSCIGQTITSYGFLSTTTVRSNAILWSQGENWTKTDSNGNHPKEPPFGKSVCFKILIPEGTSGVSYVSDFNIMNYDKKEKNDHKNIYRDDSGRFMDLNDEEQIMISPNKKYKIIDVSPVNDNCEMFTIEIIN